MNRKDVYIFSVIIIFITYLKSIYFGDIFQYENWEYHYFIYFGENQFVNIIWVVPILVQVFFISKNIYMEMCHFDLRYKNRKYLLKRMIVSLFTNQFIYVGISIIFQIVGLLVFTRMKLTWDSYMIEFICKYFVEVMCYIIVLVYFSIITSKYTISFIVALCMLIMSVMLFKTSYIPVVTLFSDYHFNYITVGCIVIMLYFIRRIYLSKDLLGGIKYDTKD